MRAVALLLIVTANLHAQTDVTKAPKNWYPIVKGHKWTYRTSGATLVQEVVAIEKIGKTECAKIAVKIGDEVVSTEHIAVTKEGVFRHAIGGNRILPPVPVIKFPLKFNKAWEVKSSVQGQLVEGKMIAEKKPLEIGKKVFTDAILVQTVGTMKAAGQDIKMEMWFAPNIGMLKQVVTVGKISTTLTIVLDEKKVPK